MRVANIILSLLYFLLMSLGKSNRKISFSISSLLATWPKSPGSGTVGQWTPQFRVPGQVNHSLASEIMDTLAGG